MKLKIFVLGTFLCGSAFAESSIEDQMGDMAKPMKLLKRMHRAKVTSGAKYNQAAKDLLKAGFAFGKYEHKEEKFKKHNKNFQIALQKYRAALKAKSHDKILTGFQLVSESCTKCHDDYKED